jgi:hypothetical protein
MDYSFGNVRYEYYLSLVEGKSGYGVTVDFAVSAARLNYCHLECNAYI